MCIYRSATILRMFERRRLDALCIENPRYPAYLTAEAAEMLREVRYSFCSRVLFPVVPLFSLLYARLESLVYFRKKMIQVRVLPLNCSTFPRPERRSGSRPRAVCTVTRASQRWQMDILWKVGSILPIMGMGDAHDCRGLREHEQWWVAPGIDTAVTPCEIIEESGQRSLPVGPMSRRNSKKGMTWIHLFHLHVVHWMAILVRVQGDRQNDFW